AESCGCRSRVVSTAARAVPLACPLVIGKDQVELAGCITPGRDARAFDLHVFEWASACANAGAGTAVFSRAGALVVESPWVAAFSHLSHSDLDFPLSASRRAALSIRRYYLHHPANELRRDRLGIHQALRRQLEHVGDDRARRS